MHTPQAPTTQHPLPVYFCAPPPSCKGKGRRAEAARAALVMHLPPELLAQCAPFVD